MLNRVLWMYCYAIWDSGLLEKRFDTYRWYWVMVLWALGFLCIGVVASGLGVPR